MRILVTGADGMLGSHICRELINRDFGVRALIQPGRSTGTLDGLKIETVDGDILDYQVLLKGLEGCDGVIHTAASTQIWPSRSPGIWRINFDAVKLLSRAVLELKIGKFIHIGTANSFAPGSKEDPGTEQNGYSDFKYRLDYQDSKYAAQEYLLEMFKSQNLPVCVINPTFMFGAYDSKPGSGQMIASLYARRIPGYTRGGKSYVAAKDVAAAAVNALEKGRNGECYLAAGQNLNYREIFRIIAGVVGVDPPKGYIPSVFVDLYGVFGSVLGSLFKIEPKISLAMARLSHTDCYYSRKKAVLELGLPETPIEKAVEECFFWLRDKGYLDFGRS